MKQFIKTEKNGILMIDRVLFESFYPICCQNNKNGIKWLIGKTEAIHIVKMLKDEISIRELFLKYTSVKILEEYQNEQYHTMYVDEWEKYSVLLPKEDSYIDAESGEFDDDIKYFMENDRVSYNPKSYKNIIITTSSINKEVIDIGEIL